MGNGILVPGQVKTYKKFLKATYDRLHINPDEWPLVTYLEYIKLVTVVKVEDHKDADVCIEAIVNGNVKHVKTMKQPIEIEQIGRCEDDRLIIVEGIPGVGKSTLAWQLGRLWAKGEILQKFHLVIVLHLRDKRVHSADKIFKLLYHSDPDIQLSVSKWVSSTLGEKVLMILDGYDELPSEQQKERSSFFSRIIRGEELPKLTVLVTSRPSINLNHLRKVQKKCQYIEVVGFCEKEIQEYVEHSLEYNSKLMIEFQSYLEQHPHIHSLMYVPINCAIVVELYKEKKKPQTLTEVYIGLTTILLKRHELKKNSNTIVESLQKHYDALVNGIQDPSGLADSLYTREVILQSVKDDIQQRDRTIREKSESLINAVQSAVTTNPSIYESFIAVLQETPYLSQIVQILQQNDTALKVPCFHGISPATYSQLQPVAELAYDGTMKDQLIFHNKPETIESLGLLQKVPEMHLMDPPTASYNFIHKTLQEFLTAWHVSSTSPEKQRKFVQKALTNHNLDLTLRFMAGLIKFQPQSPEGYGGFAEISFETNDIERWIESFHWIYETQNPAIIQSMIKNGEQKLDFTNMWTDLNPFDLHVMGYCIANGLTSWNLDFNKSMSDECVKMLCLVERGNAFYHITNLDLSAIPLSISNTSLIATALEHSTTLHDLRLNKCELGDEAIHELCRGLKSCRLKILDIGANIFELQGAKSLADALKDNSTLETLDMSAWYRISDRGVHLLMEAMNCNKTLMNLILENNHYPYKHLIPSELHNRIT